jgi:hypothetical protein
LIWTAPGNCRGLLCPATFAYIFYLSKLAIKRTFVKLRIRVNTISDASRGRDDILETFFLNMFFGGKLKGMPAKLVSDDGKHMVIRPMAYVKEAN